MTIRCPNNDCNVKLAVQDSLFNNKDSIITCPICKKDFAPYNLKEGIVKKKDISGNDTKILMESNVPVGWLIVHDEKAPSQTYDLYLGKQTIGRRKEDENIKEHICITTTDEYMSRYHFEIVVTIKNNQYQYILKDLNSKNGTFIDIKRLGDFKREMRAIKNNEEIYITDDALIRAGETNILFKSAEISGNKTNATNIVKQQEFTQTIIL